MSEHEERVCLWQNEGGEQEGASFGEGFGEGGPEEGGEARESA